MYGLGGDEAKSDWMGVSIVGRWDVMCRAGVDVVGSEVESAVTAVGRGLTLSGADCITGSAVCCTVDGGSQRIF